MILCFHAKLTLVQIKPAYNILYYKSDFIKVKISAKDYLALRNFEHLFGFKNESEPHYLTQKLLLIFEEVIPPYLKLGSTGLTIFYKYISRVFGKIYQKR